MKRILPGGACAVAIPILPLCCCCWSWDTVVESLTFWNQSHISMSQSFEFVFVCSQYRSMENVSYLSVKYISRWRSSWQSEKEPTCQTEACRSDDNEWKSFYVYTPISPFIYTNRAYLSLLPISSTVSYSIWLLSFINVQLKNTRYTRFSIRSAVLYEKKEGGEREKTKRKLMSLNVLTTTKTYPVKK